MPRVSLRLIAAAALVLAGCGGARMSEAPAPTSLPAAGQGTLASLWTALSSSAPIDQNADAMPDRCLSVYGTYAWGFGVRGLACDADRVRPLGAAVAASGLPVFVSGPHAPGAEGLGLDLASRRFGHYNPAFVEWAVETGIVGEGNPAMRAATQDVYEARLKRLARVYWLVYRGLEADGFPGRTPLGPEKEYVRYLRGGPVGVGGDDVYPGFTMTAFNERSLAVPPALGIADDDMDWYAAQYEANTAVGFWLRRGEDGTLDAFHDGLRRLLTTYDAAWLAGSG